jgi:polysaccharide biosynthesis/export protein
MKRFGCIVIIATVAFSGAFAQSSSTLSNQLQQSLTGQGSGGSSLLGGSGSSLFGLGSQNSSVLSSSNQSLGDGFSNSSWDPFASGTQSVQGIDGSTGTTAFSANQADLAMADPLYPVTPGDSYIFSFVTGAGSTTVSVVVDAGYNVNLGTLGTVAVRGQTFQQLKAYAEKKALEAYSYSAPRLVIRSPGVFQVYLRGEVEQAGFSKAWGLMRLSEVSAKPTRFASDRDIEIISAKGEVAHYDLFRALRFGDLTQNPLLKAGDTIVINKFDRKIMLKGEVKRPGIYNILNTDTLQTVIELYGDGLTKLADLSQVKVDSLATGMETISETRNLDLSRGYGSPYTLRDLDTVTIQTRTDFLPVVFIEGAVTKQIVKDPTVISLADSNKESPNTMEKLPHRFNNGETVHDIILTLEKGNQILSVADLENGYISRSSGIIPVNLSKLIYSFSPADDVTLQDNDHLVVPFKQFFITVGGAVAAPGRYPYVPGRTWKYYVNLAGGINTDLNSFNIVHVSDKSDRDKKNSATIEPEDKIIVPANSVLHYLGQISGIMSILTTTFLAFIYAKSLGLY